MRRILVVGGGVAGVETALTLSTCLPDDEITLVSAWPTLRLNPNLIYVPFGIDAASIDVPLTPVLPDAGVTLVESRCEHVDPEARRAHLADGRMLDYDVLFACPGTEAIHSDGLQLRGLTDAKALRAGLAALEPGERPEIAIRLLSEGTWSAPGVEVALLAAEWAKSQGLSDKATISLITAERHPVPLFGVDVEDLIDGYLKTGGVGVATGVPAGRIESIAGTVNIDFGSLKARELDGLPRTGGDGFYEVDGAGRIGEDHYVVGDAANIRFKSGFSTAWQARRSAVSLGGSLDLLGDVVDGVTVHAAEYQMDLGAETLVIRFPADRMTDIDIIGNFVQTWTASEPPDKLRGLLTRELLIGDHVDKQPAHQFRDLVSRKAKA